MRETISRLAAAGVLIDTSSMRVYFSGISGVAIGPLAMIAQDLGMDVVGSDMADSLILQEVAKRGIPVSIGQSSGFIEQQHAQMPITWFVYTSALPNDHPELVFAREQNIRVSKRDEFINEILRAEGLRMIAIAGTHGKTTTTAMTTWLFKQLNIPVSYSIGTKLSWAPMGAHQQGSKHFIYECDEYDRNFLSFRPYMSLITSLDYDHPDTYPTPAEYQKAFRDFVDQSEWTYGWDSDEAAVHGQGRNNFSVLQADDAQLAQLKLAGAHNRRNAWLAIQAVSELTETPINRLVEIMNQFPGTARRFERLAENIYTDYGHHPVEIRATLQLAHELNDHVIVVYQPHQNARQHAVASDYQDCFSGADTVYWVPTYLSREDESQAVLTPQDLISKLTTDNAQPAELNLALAEQLKREAAAGKLIIAMGAGPIDDWARNHLV